MGRPWCTAYCDTSSSVQVASGFTLTRWPTSSHDTIGVAAQGEGVDALQDGHPRLSSLEGDEIKTHLSGRAVPIRSKSQREWCRRFMDWCWLTMSCGESCTMQQLWPAMIQIGYRSSTPFGCSNASSRVPGDDHRDLVSAAAPRSPASGASTASRPLVSARNQAKDV